MPITKTIYALMILRIKTSKFFLHPADLKEEMPLVLALQFYVVIPWSMGQESFHSVGRMINDVVEAIVTAFVDRIHLNITLNFEQGPYER